jgi:S-adenosylmethionine decarboxylase
VDGLSGGGPASFESIQSYLLGLPMNGLHLTADLRGCDPASPPMFQADALRAACIAVVRASGLTMVGELFHPFMPARAGHAGGVTGVILLAESHVAVHTWPELRAVTLDVYVCNVLRDNSVQADALMLALEAIFQPGEVERQRLTRGELAP